LKKASDIRPLGHVAVPVAVIGSLSILLAVGLDLLGILGRLNEAVLEKVSQGKDPVFPNSLPDGLGWLVAVLCGFALPFAMLSVAGAWRRWVLWISTLFLMVSWIPVLVLAAYAPVICVPLVGVFWSGMCALVYASRHQMPCDPLGSDLKK
jgi:hypothetical protein